MVYPQHYTNTGSRNQEYETAMKITTIHACAVAVFWTTGLVIGTAGAVTDDSKAGNRKQSEG
jgi:hypothetical protein